LQGDFLLTFFADALVQLRILSDERALRKVVRKFYTFAFAVAPGSADNEQTGAEMSLEEAREQLLAEIATFNMHLQKSALICQAEARQVMEYEKEKERICAYVVLHFMSISADTLGK